MGCRDCVGPNYVESAGAAVHLNGVVNPSAPVATGDSVNSIVFSSTIFGQLRLGNSRHHLLPIARHNLVEADLLFNTAQTWTPTVDRSNSDRIFMQLAIFVVFSSRARARTRTQSS